MNFTIEGNPEITFSSPSKDTVLDIYFDRDIINRICFLYRKDTDMRIITWRTNKKAFIQRIGKISPFIDLLL